MKDLDIRDISIVDAFPVYDCPKEVFTVGCGSGRIEWHLAKRMGYKVVATDIKRMVEWEDEENLSYHNYNILKFNNKTYPIVVCAQVLEHLRDWKTAFKNLINHAEVRLVVTFPYKRSFYNPDHVNIWDEENIKEFKNIAKPYTVSLSRIRTKPRDKEMKQWGWLLTVDKRQKYE